VDTTNQLIDTIDTRLSMPWRMPDFSLTECDLLRSEIDLNFVVVIFKSYGKING